jgi:hypothetical protein
MTNHRLLRFGRVSSSKSMMFPYTLRNMASASSSPGAAALPRKRACRCCDMNVKPIIQPPPPVLGTGEDEDGEDAICKKYCQNISGDQQNLTDCSDCSNIKITGEVDMSTNYNIPPGHTVNIDITTDQVDDVFSAQCVVVHPGDCSSLTITNSGNIITNFPALLDQEDTVINMVNYGDISGSSEVVRWRAGSLVTQLPIIDNHGTITMNGVTATTQCSTKTELFGFPISNGWKIDSSYSSYCCASTYLAEVVHGVLSVDFAGRCIDQAAVCIDIDACANINKPPPPTHECLRDLSAGYCNPCPVSSHIDFSAALANPLCRKIGLTYTYTDTTLNIPDNTQLIILKGGKVDVSNITVGNNGGITIGRMASKGSGGTVNCSELISFGDITGGMGITIYDGSGNFKDVSFGNISDTGEGIRIVGGGGTFTGKVSFGDISGMGIWFWRGSGNFNDVSFGNISGTGIYVEGYGSGTFAGNVSFGNISGGKGIDIEGGSVTLHDKVSFDNINDNGLGIYFYGTDNSKITMSPGAGVCVDSSCNTPACINNVCYDAAAREMSGNCIMNGITGPGDVSLCAPN